jgi:hypothetical protein
VQRGCLKIAMQAGHRRTSLYCPGIVNAACGTAPIAFTLGVHPALDLVPSRLRSIGIREADQRTDALVTEVPGQANEPRRGYRRGGLERQLGPMTASGLVLHGKLMLKHVSGPVVVPAPSWPCLLSPQQ